MPQTRDPLSGDKMEMISFEVIPHIIKSKEFRKLFVQLMLVIGKMGGTDESEQFLKENPDFERTYNEVESKLLPFLQKRSGL